MQGRNLVRAIGAQQNWMGSTSNTEGGDAKNKALNYYSHFRIYERYLSSNNFGSMCILHSRATSPLSCNNVPTPSSIFICVNPISYYQRCKRTRKSDLDKLQLRVFRQCIHGLDNAKCGRHNINSTISLPPQLP